MSTRFCMNLTRWWITRWLERCFAPHEENVVWILLIQTARKHLFQDYRLILWAVACAILPIAAPAQFLHYSVVAFLLLTIAVQMLFFRSAVTLKQQLTKEGKAGELLTTMLTNEEWHCAFLRFFYMGFTAIQLPVLFAGFTLFLRFLPGLNYIVLPGTAWPGLVIRALAYDVFASGLFVGITVFPQVFAGYWVLLGWNRDVLKLWVLIAVIAGAMAFIFGPRILAMLVLLLPFPMIMFGWVGYDCCRTGFPKYLREAVFEREK